MFRFVIDDDIELRLVESRYAEECYKVICANKSHLKKWLPWVENNTIEDTKLYIEVSKKQYCENNGFQAFIFCKDKIIGSIGYHKFDWIHKTTSIGYWLSEDYIGKGIMTRVCKKFIDYAFVDLDLNRVEIRCAQNNYKSRAIPERLGFTNEGTIREAQLLNGIYVNHVIYGIIKREWK